MNKNKIKNIKDKIYKKVNNNYLVNYKIIAIGLNKKDDIVGIETNKINCENSKIGCGRHAELELINHYGKSIKSIVLYRKGKDMNHLLIHPCKKCEKVLKKLKIKGIIKAKGCLFHLVTKTIICLYTTNIWHTITFIY
jgi:cytidine deaminase